MNLCFGIDLGGTKIEIIAMDKQGKTLLQRRVTTPRHDYEATLDVMTKLVHQTEAELDQQGSLGIGVPGSLSPLTGLMRNANSICLNGQPLKRDMEKRLKRPVIVANDANCFALSEATDGAAEKAASVFAVIVGTGTGAGIVINKKILNGPNGIAGEWGHNPLPWPTSDEIPGAQCWCGLNSCIETWLSGPGLARDYYQQAGKEKTAEEIVAASEAGEKAADEVLQRYENRMARALAHIINVLDPEIIVLGGGLSNVQRLYKNIPEQWGEYIFSDCVNTKLVPPKYGDSSGVRGAAWLGKY